MNIWLLSPFSPLPEPGMHESRTSALTQHLTDAGHEVVWFSMDWDHRRKEKQGAGNGGQGAGGREQGCPSDKRTISPSISHSPLAVNERQPHAPCSLPHAPCQIFPIPVPPYTKNISLRRFWSHFVWGNRLVRTARRMVAEGELATPDLILASSPPLDAPRAALRLQKQFDCTVKIDLTDLWPHSFQSAFSKFPVPAPQLLSPIFHLLLRQAHAHWRNANGISAMSREYLDEVQSIAPDQDTHLCYIGGQIQYFDVGRSMLDVGRSTCDFLYLGALTDSYDFETLFEATKILIAEGHDFHIHIAGSGPLETTLQQTTHNRQLTTHFTFHGFLNQKEMQSLCAKCDVGLNIIRQGLHITMPHKLNDYLCAGLPVINSLPGESANLLENYQAGLSYPAGDAATLADCMRHYIQRRPAVPCRESGFPAEDCGTTDTKNAPQNGALKLAAEKLDRRKTYPEWIKWLLNSH